MNKDYGYRYQDRYGEGKEYIFYETRRLKAEDTPLELNYRNHLVGEGRHDKKYVIETVSAVEIPVLDNDGERCKASLYYIKYQGGKGALTIMPDGEIDSSDKQHIRRNMVPGMTRIAGEFSRYEIPETEIKQTIPGTYSSFKK